MHGGRPAGTSGCQCGFSGCSRWYLWNNSTFVWQDEHAGGWGTSHAYIYSNKCNNDTNDHHTYGLILKIKPSGGKSPNHHRVEAVKPAVSQQSTAILPFLAVPQQCFYLSMIQSMKIKTNKEEGQQQNHTKQQKCHAKANWPSPSQKQLKLISFSVSLLALVAAQEQAMNTWWRNVLHTGGEETQDQHAHE